MSAPWDDVLVAATRVVNTESIGSEQFRQGVAWLLRREAGHAAATFNKLVKDGLPEEHAATLATSDGGYIVAEAMTAAILGGSDVAS